MKNIVLLILSDLLIFVVQGSAAKQPIKPLIVNGQDSFIEDNPHQVSLRLFNQHVCGGSLVTFSHVITAAHCLNPCVKAFIQRYYTVMAGSSIVWMGKTIPIEDCACHKKFSSVTFDFDVAVIKLAEKQKYSRQINIIKLPPKNYKISTVIPAKVTGWGFTKDHGSPTQILQTANVSIFPHARCVRAYSDYQTFTGNMLCAGLVKKNKTTVDTCDGDSGGPLVQSGYLVGVVSWGAECASHKYPGVYANVTCFHDWIYATLLRLK